MNPALGFTIYFIIGFIVASTYYLVTTPKEYWFRGTDLDEVIELIGIAVFFPIALIIFIRIMWIWWREMSNSRKGGEQ